MKDELIKKSYISSFDTNNKLIKDLMIINTKCLVDNNTQRQVYLDRARLREEILYYKFYGQSIDDQNLVDINLLNIILPVILSNTNIQKSEEESVSIIQNYAKFFKQESKLQEYILATVMYNTAIHKLIENKNIEYVELLQFMKESVIGFNMQLDKINTIKFQMAKINTIQQVDKYIDKMISNTSKDSIIIDVLDVMYEVYIENNEDTEEGKKSIKKSILSIIGEEPNLNIDNIDFILSMSQYITKIRKYEIKKTPYNQNGDPRHIINLNEGDIYMDPILGKIKVISKKLTDNILYIDVHAKSGAYTLKFKKL